MVWHAVQEKVRDAAKTPRAIRPCRPSRILLCSSTTRFLTKRSSYSHRILNCFLGLLHTALDYTTPRALSSFCNIQNTQCWFLGIQKVIGCSTE